MGIGCAERVAESQLVEEFLPVFDVSDAVATVVEGDRETAWEALLDVDLLKLGRGADRIAAYIDCPRSRVYALTSARRIPVHHDGSALIARRSELDGWIREGGGRRP